MLEYLKYLWRLAFKCTSVVGLEREYAEDVLEHRKIEYRIVSIDSKGMIITEDYNPERLNLYVVRGKITQTRNG